MTPNIVVDVGNTAIKWGLCADGAVKATCSLSPDDPSAWLRQMQLWSAAGGLWIVTGVHPSRRTKLSEWLRERGQRVVILDDPAYLPLRVLVPRPGHVGIDRLFDAVAANSRRAPGARAVVIDAGSAVTVDLLDEEGAFVGGAILPGLRLMAKGLHDYTALLPIIEPPSHAPPLPGKSTVAAMEAGIFWAVAGGIEALVREYHIRIDSSDSVFLTGGDGARLHGVFPNAHLWPAMTLEGIRLSAETLS